jgi:hypothetical protein
MASGSSLVPWAKTVMGAVMIAARMAVRAGLRDCMFLILGDSPDVVKDNVNENDSQLR